MSVKGSGEWDISVCGLNCAKCDVLARGQCRGCRGPLAHHWSPDCKFPPCAREKGHQYCFECGDFPCEELQKFSSDGRAHHRRTVENMKRMKEIGIEAWILEQKRKGQCLFCP